MSCIFAGLVMLEAETEGEEVEREEKDRKRRRKTRAILPHLMGWGKKGSVHV